MSSVDSNCNQPLSFFTFLNWTEDREGCRRNQGWKDVFCTIAEFYISYGNQMASIQACEGNLYKVVLGDYNFPKQSIPLRNAIRNATLLSLSVLTVRAISTVAVTVGKERTPLLFKMMQTPLQGFIAHALGALVTTGALIAVILTAIKIAVRCSSKIEIIIPGKPLNVIPVEERPSVDELD